MSGVICKLFGISYFLLPRLNHSDFDFLMVKLNHISFYFNHQLYLLLSVLLQHIKKNRDPRWEKEFEFVCEEPPINDKLHVEVISRPSSIGIHSKVPN
jgi:hypothetical protein